MIFVFSKTYPTPNRLIQRKLLFFRPFSFAGISFNSQKQGPRMKCSACKIIAHANCISVLIDKGAQLACKPTFRDVGVRQYREQTRTHHHWIHRRTEKGKCKQCGKVSIIRGLWLNVPRLFGSYYSLSGVWCAVLITPNSSRTWSNIKLR